MIKSIPNGVYPTMVTPFTDDNKIDYNAVLQLLEWYDGKVDGIFAICQSSEIFYLSFEERLELLQFIMKNKPADMSVVASGHTEDDLDRQIYEANAFIAEGPDAYVFISNRLAGENESDEVFLTNFDKFVSGIPEIALGIYECPYPYKRLMTPDTLARLARGGRLKFLKDTCCDIEQIRAKLEATKGTGLKIFNANSSTLLDTLRLGVSGFSGVMGNFHPEVYHWLCHNFDKDAEKAQVVQDFVGFFSVAECQLYPVNAKYYLGLDGVDMGIMTRSKDPAGLTQNRRLEIEQMHRMTQRFKEVMGI